MKYAVMLLMFGIWLENLSTKEIIEVITLLNSYKMYYKFF